LLSRFAYPVIVAAIGLPLTSCTVGPDYKAPQPTVEPAFVAATTRPAAATQPSVVSTAAATDCRMVDDAA